jgi:hypothetical protein
MNVHNPNQTYNIEKKILKVGRFKFGLVKKRCQTFKGCTCWNDYNNEENNTLSALPL